MKNNNTNIFKFFVIFIIILVLYILLRYFQTPFEFSQNNNSMFKGGREHPAGTLMEGLENSPEKTEANAYSPNKISIQSVSNGNVYQTQKCTNCVHSSSGTLSSLQSITDMPLSQYCIKSSYNSAISGKYVSEDMLINVIKQGCRFIDFEIVYDASNNAPYVAYTTDASFQTIDTKNKILLDKLLVCAVNHGLSISAPNIKDPLLIQLRIKSNNQNVYKAVAKSVHATLSNKLFTGRFDENTTLDDIMGKVVLIMDKTIHSNYRSNTKCLTNDKDCYDLTQFIKLESGSELMKKDSYASLLKQKTYPLYINDDDKTTNIYNMHIAEPDIKDKNPKISDFVLGYGTQIVTSCFYKDDDELTKYEKFFSDNEYAFVPMSTAIKYFKKEKQQQKSTQSIVPWL